MASLLIFFFFFFNYKVSVWKLSINEKRKKASCQKVDVVKNKNLENVIEEQLQAEARFIVLHPGFEETGEG